MTDPTLRERLRNSIEDDRLVLFCGAGLSMARPSQVPSVAELARICSETYALDYSTVLPDDVATDLEKMAEYFLAKTLLVPTFVNRLIPRGPFLYPQQIIWDKGRAVLTRTHYWFQHEPCWYVRKKNAPWYGKPGGENTSIWSSPSPKFLMGGSDEQKFDHPTQKPVALMRHSILNHTKTGELVYEPFLGSGTTLAAAELTERVCCGVELDPKYVDVIVQRWQTLSGKEATLEGHGATFEHVKHGRQAEKEDHDKDDALRILEDRAGVAAT